MLPRRYQRENTLNPPTVSPWQRKRGDASQSVDSILQDAFKGQKARKAREVTRKIRGWRIGHRAARLCLVTKNVSIGVKRTAVSQPRIIEIEGIDRPRDGEYPRQFEAARLIREHLRAFDTSKRSAFCGGTPPGYLPAYVDNVSDTRAQTGLHTRSLAQPAGKWKGSLGARPTFPFSLKTPLHAPLAWLSKPVLSPCTRYSFATQRVSSAISYARTPPAEGARVHTATEAFFLAGETLTAVTDTSM